MSKSRTVVIVLGTFVILAGLGSWAIIRGRSSAIVLYLTKKPNTPAKALAIQQVKDKAKTPAARNTSLQPEAFRMSQRMGQRFESRKREESVINGTLTIGPDHHVLQIVRTQTDRGEDVGLHIAESQSDFTWTALQGARSLTGRANAADRSLIERLVFDSADQFVLAQLRGASYCTVASNVRPKDAGDKYSGALWDIVRVTDSDTDDSRKPQSTWRLYYLNVTTGLIDKIVSEVGGQRITAELSGWTEISGERVPAHIRWVTENQTLMQYDVANFSHAATQGAQ